MSVAGIKYYLSDPKRLFDFAASRGLLNGMSDEKFIKKKFRLVFGYELKLDAPETFNEKLQWLKLFDRKPLYTQLVDKYEVRKYIAEKIGEEYLIPLVGGPWDSADEIDFDALPESFVLKCTHDSGGLIICKDKASLDIEAAKAKLSKCLRRNFYYMNREWPYKDVKPRIIAEKYMENDPNEGLHDYKLWCFNGKVRFIQYVTGRIADDTLDGFYTPDWELTDISFVNPPMPESVPRPDKLDELISCAEYLAVGFSFVRIDFYIISGRLYFGEITLYPMGGFQPLTSSRYGTSLGNMLMLHTKETYNGKQHRS